MTRAKSEVVDEKEEFFLTKMHTNNELQVTSNTEDRDETGNKSICVT
jgi:hypothetical protein